MFPKRASIDFTIHPMLIELHIVLLLLPQHNQINTNTHACWYMIIKIRYEFTPSRRISQSKNRENCLLTPEFFIQLRAAVLSL